MCMGASKRELACMGQVHTGMGVMCKSPACEHVGSAQAVFQ